MGAESIAWTKSENGATLTAGNVSLAADYCDRVIAMCQGELLLEDARPEADPLPALRARAGGARLPGDR